MLSILVKDNYLILVEGIPDIYLSNADFDKVLREPQLLKQIKQDMHLDNNFLIGRLGEEKDGVNGADIGFASRNFNEEEDVTNALSSGVYCIDAVVAVVNKNNALTDITADALNQIYSGTLTDFSLVK